MIHTINLQWKENKFFCNGHLYYEDDPKETIVLCGGEFRETFDLTGIPLHKVKLHTTRIASDNIPQGIAWCQAYRVEGPAIVVRTWRGSRVGSLRVIPVTVRFDKYLSSVNIFPGTMFFAWVTVG